MFITQPRPIILQSVLKPGSHGCVGLAEDGQVLLALCGNDVSAGWWCTGGGGTLISVETSVRRVWFIHRRLPLRLMWSHWERRALRSCQNKQFREKQTRKCVDHMKGCWSNLHMCMLELQWSFSGCERRRFCPILEIQDLTGGKHSRNESEDVRVERVSKPEEVNSPLWASRPASCSLLSCWAFIPSSSSVWSSFSTAFACAAKQTDALMKDLSIKNIQRFREMRHLLSPLRLNGVLGGRGDFLRLKGQICLRVKWKEKNTDQEVTNESLGNNKQTRALRE